MVAIKDLPEELVLEILKALHKRVSKQQFLIKIQTCKYWYKIGLPILYHDLVLQYSQLFYQTPLHFDTKHVEHTKNIIVQASNTIPGDYPTIKSPEWVGNSNELIYKAIPWHLASKLTSVGLYSKITSRFSPGFAPSSVKAMLEALPKTVIKLDLDIPDLGFTHELRIGSNRTHLCHSLSPILKRLHSLRIRSALLCEDLFAGLQETATCKHGDTNNSPTRPKFPLRHILIRLDPGNWVGPTRHCSEFHDLNRGPAAKDWTWNGYTDSRLSKTIEEIYKSGLFANLHSFKVVELCIEENASVHELEWSYDKVFVFKEFDAPLSPDEDKKLSIFSYKVSDILNNTTKDIPFSLKRTRSEFKRKIAWGREEIAEESWNWIDDEPAKAQK